MKPLIFDIKRGSVVDGPGIRTAVFFKGCNLDCFWCHNPEGKNPDAQIAFFAEKCAGCGICRKVCPSPESCILCGSCVDCCYRQARKIYGKEYEEKELLAVICRDKDYYAASGGGVTFSGGECMLWPDALAKLAESCSLTGISVAVDTAGNVSWDSFEKVLPYTDLFLYDIKCLDSALHKKGTGCDNRLILENLDRLIKTGKQILIRVPVIPGFNDGEELEKIRTYCRERNLPVEELAYHALGESKSEALAALSKPDTHKSCGILSASSDISSESSH